MRTLWLILGILPNDLAQGGGPAGMEGCFSQGRMGGQTRPAQVHIGAAHGMDQLPQRVRLGDNVIRDADG